MEDVAFCCTSSASPSRELKGCAYELSMVLGKFFPFLAVLADLTIRLDSDIVDVVRKYYWPKLVWSSCVLLGKGVVEGGTERWTGADRSC